MRTCFSNPNREKNIEAQKRGSRTMNQKICEREHQHKLINEATRQNHLCKCSNDSCDQVFVLKLTDYEYKRYINGFGKYRRYCDKCAHSLGGKANAKLLNDRKSRKNINQQNRIIPIISLSKQIKVYHFEECLVCHCFFMKVKKTKFCSNACKLEYQLNRTKYLSDKARARLSKAGKKSAAKQFKLKRSKCEIEFCQLCEKHFDMVEHNVPKFNGWDADILLPNLKIAIQWNGPWHYKQISKKKTASLASIQNRDRIKRQEIENMGWSLYIIKDQDSHKNKQKRLNFVKNHFDRFISFIATHKEKQFYEEFEL